MCGRFVRYCSIQDLINEYDADTPSFDLAPNYNTAPGQEIAAVYNDGHNHILKCKWGFVPSWARDSKIGYKMINARAESVADKPSYKSAFRHNRIIIPANGFYEWKREGRNKTPVYIHLKSKKPFGFAGLLSVWTGDRVPLNTCTIITTDATSALKSIHDRMPVILKKEDERLWLDPENTDINRLNSLLKPYKSEDIEYYEVSSLVNTPSHNSPECLKPI